jgi:hypothetical protein
MRKKQNEKRKWIGDLRSDSLALVSMNTVSWLHLVMRGFTCNIILLVSLGSSCRCYVRRFLQLSANTASLSVLLDLIQVAVCARCAAVTDAVSEQETSLTGGRLRDPGPQAR